MFVELYMEAFRRAGIPVRPEGSRTFFQRQEVRDLANLLQAVDDPLDQVALFASLRTSALACSDEEIYLHVAGGRLDYRLDANDSSPPPVRGALALLRDLHDLRSRVSLAQLVRATLEKTRLVEIALAGCDGQQTAANLVKLADEARAFSASGGGGLRAFARWLAQQRGGAAVSEASVTEETDDVVRVMAIHSAKGLEFPIVALANLGSRPRMDVEPVPERAARRLHLRIKNGDAEFKTPEFDAAWEARACEVPTAGPLAVDHPKRCERGIHDPAARRSRDRRPLSSRSFALPRAAAASGEAKPCRTPLPRSSGPVATFAARGRLRRGSGVR